MNRNRQQVSVFQVWLVQRPTAAVLSACLILAVFIGFLLATNYRTQTALRESTYRRVRLDLEKRAASLGYFFSERRNDLQNLASSREVTAYFLNKSLGMSETYGLKVNLFVIRELLERTRTRKRVHRDAIYQRLFLTDAAGGILADTNPDGGAVSIGPRPAEENALPAVIVREEGGAAQIFLAAPCIFQDEVVGGVTCVLDTSVLKRNFVDFSTEFSRTAFFLIAESGTPIGEGAQPGVPISGIREPHWIESMAAHGGGPLGGSRDGGRSDLFFTHAPIHNAPLFLLACMDREEIRDSLSPWQLLWGTGSLAVVILLGLVLLLRFNEKGLALQTQVDETERQKRLLAEKNRQLKNEIALRKQAETELENQRTLQMRSDRLRSLGEMAAGIAHELNQPLVGIRGMAEILQMNLETGNALRPEKTANRLSLILAQVDRMVHIIDHVRRFARESGRPETQRADLNDIVRSGVSLLQNQFHGRGISMVLDLSQNSMPVEVNPFSMEEVILNLLSNARDSMEARREGDALGDYAPEVRVATWNGMEGEEERVFLSIQDNGLGIPQPVAARIFDPFFTTKPPDRGTGLGLSICKSITEEFFGKIEVSGEEGKGATFFLSFPRESEPKTHERKSA
jgi:signal transduction histidine kinase